MNYLSIFFGCGVGGLARYALTRYASEHILTAFPSGTLAVNVIGSFLIGFFFALFKDSMIPSSVRLLVTTGFLGGFTTFSTYALETIILFDKREIRAGVMNFLAHNCIGFVAVVCGFLAYTLIRLAAGGGSHA